MAEYIERDKERLARLRKEAQKFQDDIICAVGTDFMQTIAEAENRMIFDILDGLENEPTADVVEVRHGKWVTRHSDVSYWCECSACGHTPPRNSWRQEYHSDFCPNCGAKMDGKGVEND